MSYPQLVLTKDDITGAVEKIEVCTEGARMDITGCVRRFDVGLDRSNYHNGEQRFGRCTIILDLDVRVEAWREA